MAKVRIVGCGNVAEYSIERDLQYRAEVPRTFDKQKNLSTQGSGKEWSACAMDIQSSFLYAPLVEEADGMHLVTPPGIRQRMGLVRRGVLWKLKQALYGWRIALKIWMQT